MDQGLGLEETVVAVPEAESFEPVLLVSLDPWHRVFFRNLRDLFWSPSQPPLDLLSFPAAPWPDVFVVRPLPWRGFLGSVVCHAGALAAILALIPLLSRPPILTEQAVFKKSDVLYYTPAEYLPPLDTGSTQISAPKAQAGDPEFSPQEVISVPPEADNRTQTIVTAPNVKLDRDVALPNIVKWSNTDADVAMPLTATARTAADLNMPSLTAPVVAPAPDMSTADVHRAPEMRQDVVAPAPDLSVQSSRHGLQGPEADVVAPPPRTQETAIRKLGDFDIGHSEVVAPAPRLTLGEQRTARSSPGTGSAPAVAPPPPAMQGAGAAASGGGRIIALNVRPLPPDTPAETPSGNRRGSFAATPEGKPGATGTPKIEGSDAASSKGESTETNGKAAAGVPPGLHVGSNPHTNEASAVASGSAGNGGGIGSSPGQTVDRGTLMANATPPRITGTPRRSYPENATSLERQVFGDRRFYSMSLNMPNLNSAGGSWVVRFAELKDDNQQGELTAPVAINKVDPAYPLELMRHNVQGTVTLYAVIRSDGSVADVRVLQGVDDRLDEYARAALLKWRFHPATRNGTAVDLETVVMIPFKPSLNRSNF